MIQSFTGAQASVIQCVNLGLLAAVCLGLSVWVFLKGFMIESTLYAIFSISAIRLMGTYTSPYNFDDTAFYLLSLSATRSLLTASLLLMIGVFIPRRSILILDGLILFSACFTGFSMVFDKNSGLYQNASANGTFLTLCLPLSFYYAKNILSYFVLVPILIGIFLSGSTTAFLSISVLALVFFVSSNRRYKFTAALMSIPLIAVFPFNHSLSQDNGRLELWYKTFHFFMDGGHSWVNSSVGTYFVKIFYRPPWILGFGPGSFAGALESIIHQHFWLSPHNDWLEMGFHCGIIFLVLAIVLAVKTFIKVRRITWLSAATSAFCVSMFFQPMLSNIVGCLYALSLWKKSLSTD